MNDRTTLLHHSLTSEQFEALAKGSGDPTAIGRLVAGQLSKHLILLGKVGGLARRGDRSDDGLAAAGQELLALVQRQDRVAANEVIGYPSVGAWALQTIRGDQTIPGARPSGLAAVAAAAAVKAGLDVEIEVPVVNGLVGLPSLGAADAVGSTAIVATRAGEVRSRDLCVKMSQGALGWRDLRTLRVGSLNVTIDDLDPFRLPATDDEPTDRLTPAEVDELHAMLRAAWPLLSPASAAEVSSVVRVIVPCRGPERGHVSTSSPQTFGTVAMSGQPDKYTCAETLVHETQHLKLCALLQLLPLTRPDNGQRYYAPWRTDPRPASGLLQGAYAFLGVSGFWRRQRQIAPEREVRQRAQAAFARWRDGAALVVETLLASGQLTPEGQAFAGEMAGVLYEWGHEPVPEDARLAARRSADRHLSQWRADNG